MPDDQSPAAASGDAFAEVQEAFELLPDWEERYRYVIELGRSLAPVSDAEKTATNKVDGCVSQVWLVSEAPAGPEGALRFRADSDAHIVRGLLAILLRLYDGRSPREILEIDARAQLDSLDLEGHLSPSRTNGLFSMVKRIRALAAEQAA
ncbi:MAG: SufE family protein [Pseudomonadota bacterium]